MRGRPEAVAGDAERARRRRRVERRRWRPASPFHTWLRAPLIREHGRRERSRGDGPSACRAGGSVVPERDAFRRPVVDAGDDTRQFLDRLDARSGKRRQRRILAPSGRRRFWLRRARTAAGAVVPARARQGRRTAPDRRGRSNRESRAPGRHVRRELVFDVLLDLAPVGDILLMLINVSANTCPPVPSATK